MFGVGLRRPAAREVRPVGRWRLAGKHQPVASARMSDVCCRESGGRSPGHDLVAGTSTVPDAVVAAGRYENGSGDLLDRDRERGLIRARGEAGIVPCTCVVERTGDVLVDVRDAGNRRSLPRPFGVPDSMAVSVGVGSLPGHRGGSECDHEGDSRVANADEQRGLGAERRTQDADAGCDRGQFVEVSLDRLQGDPSWRRRQAGGAEPGHGQGGDAVRRQRLSAPGLDAAGRPREDEQSQRGWRFGYGEPRRDH